MCVYVYMCITVHVYMCTCVYVYMCIEHTHAHTHSCIHSWRDSVVVRYDDARAEAQ